MNLTTICRSFPESPNLEIRREHLLDTIDKIFEGGTHLIVIEGVEGIGKTTLLAQYAKRYPHHALSLFIKPSSRLAYAPEYLKLDLSEQIHWILYKEVFDSKLADESFLHTQLPILQKRAQKNLKPFYFIIDGLHDIPKEDSRIKDIILKDILPIGLKWFYFLLSGDLKQLCGDMHKSVSCKSFPLPTFSVYETEKYLKDLDVTRQEFEDVCKICKGIPGHLAIVRRMLQSGANIKSILDEDPDKLPDFLAMECRKIKEASYDQKKILAVIAYGRKTYSIDELARILALEKSTIEGFLLGLGIVTIDSQKTQVCFISEAHRKYATKQLHDLKEEVNNLLIDDLLKDANSDTALLYLPDHYEQAGRLNELLDYLTPDYFTKVLEHSQSMNSIQHRADLGLTTARKLERDGALVRFSLQKSIITELEGIEIWRSEIEARMALKDYDAAMALAQSAVLKEDRLHLLTIIAKIKQEQGLLLEQELMEQIRLLYDQVDKIALGDRAIEIASDLIYSDPDLAINMVETATSTNETKDTLDWAFAKLSIAALNANRDRTQYLDAFEKTHSRIKDPKIHGFFTAASVFFGDYSVNEVITHVEKLDINNRLFFLRLWAKANQERNDAAIVIDYSLDLLIRNTPYTPKTRDLREIATPLPFISDTFKSKQLVGRFDSQKGSTENLGATEDYVRLQLLLAQTEGKYDFDAACNRILEVYWYVNNLHDLAVKTECVAWMVASLNDIDPKKILESKEGLHTVLQEELRSNIEQLLLTTAEHYHVARGPIIALTKTKPKMALELANSLNTKERRDLAILELIKTAVEIPVNNIDLDFIESATKSIIDSEIKDEAIVRIIKRISTVNENLNPQVVANTLPLINSIKDIKDAYERCKACCYAYSFLSKQDLDKYSGLASNLLDQLHTAWESIDEGWRRVNVGFKISRILAKSSSEMARKYLDLNDKIRNENIINAEASALAYLSCLRLAIRAYSGLLPKNINKAEDMERLATLIDHVPSNGDRVGLWGELAIRCFVNKQIDECKRIVVNHIKPLLQDISIDDVNYKNQVLIATAPALFCAHRTTSLETISILPQHQRDEAYDQICHFIFCKLPTSEPYNNLSGDGYLLNYEESVDICELLNLMSTDYMIYYNIEKLADSLLSRRNRDTFSKQQKADISSRLENIINIKLPDQQNIKHDGYKIAALAQVARIRQERFQTWEDLLKRAQNIPNIADRALVLSMISIAMPSKEVTRRDQIVEEAKKLIDSIPVDLDRVNRYVALSEKIADVDLASSKKCLKAAMEVALRNNDSELIYPSQRRIIDLAHRLDPEYAASLVSLMDNDPARTKTSTDLKRRLHFLDTAKKMLDQEPLKDDSKISKSDYPRASWLNLGRLNAGRIAHVHFDSMRKHIEVAAEFPLHESYPILAWVIENVIKRVSNTDQARTFVIPMFEATLIGAELARKIAVRSLSQLKQVKSSVFKSSSSSTNIIIQAGEREKAISILKDWFTKEVRDYLKICDPFFGIHDLEVLQILRPVNPQCKIFILTSKKQQDHDKLSQPWDEAFRTHWRVHISDQDPPDTEIAIVGNESSGDLPIHDRWWLTNGGGIRIGTSFNSLGITKSSEITILSSEEAEMREKEVDRYLKREKREYNKEKLHYILFTL